MTIRPSGIALSCLLLASCLLAACGQEPPRVSGFSTALKEGRPVYEPFAEGPLRDMGPGSYSSTEGPADFLFAKNVTPIRLKISASEWDALINDFSASGNRSGIKRRADMVVGDSLLHDVGLAVMGRGSLRIPELDGQYQRSNFMIDFGATFSRDATAFGSGPIAAKPQNEDRRFFGLPAMILKANDRDRTYMRPYLVAEMMNEFGVPTPRIGFAALHLDIGDRESVYLGVYQLHEFVDEEWFTRRLGSLSCIYDIGKGGTGYGHLDLARDYSPYDDTVSPCDQGTIGIPILNDSDPRWTGQPFDPTYTWLGGRNDCGECEDSLMFLIFMIRYCETPVLVAEVVDVETMLRYMTISAFTGNVDDFWIFGNNTFLCRSDSPEGGVWTPVPLDFDLTYNQEYEDLRNPSGSVLRYGTGSNLGARLLARESVRDLYRNLVWTWYKKLESRPIAQRARATAAVIREYLQGYEVEDPYPFSEEAVQELVRFAEAKAAVARNELGLD